MIPCKQLSLEDFYSKCNYDCNYIRENDTVVQSHIVDFQTNVDDFQCFRRILLIFSFLLPFILIYAKISNAAISRGPLAQLVRATGS